VIDAVLLIAFGGPTRREEIRPFLENVTRGRRIPEERIEEVAHHYEQMPGARSPLNELTERQAGALGAALARDGLALPVYVGMRNWHPYLHETLAEMASRGHRRVLGIILSALRTEASWERYQEDVAAARARVPDAPEVEFADPWCDHPRFVAAVAERARAALENVPAERRPWTPLVFTAHSIPLEMAAASPYVAQLTDTARRVAAALDHRRYSIAYQSRSGDPRVSWLEPDIGHVLRSLASSGERDAVVVPAGFVCDHVEVLYDLDVEATAIAAEHGLRLHRAAALNDHPAFIDVLADVVRRHAEAAARRADAPSGR
jgi:ferrochelatase